MTAAAQYRLDRISANRRVLGWIAILPFLLVPKLALADVELTVTPPEAAAAASAPPVFFAEQPESVDLIVSGALSCPSITAWLVQKASRLAAPISRRQLIDCDQPQLRFDGAPQTVAFAFSVPKVKRQSRLEWQFVECDATGADCRDLAGFVFDAVPADPLAAMRAWAVRESLVVKDRGGALSNFLDQQEIRYAVRRSGIARNSQVVSLLVEGDKAMGMPDIQPFLDKGGVVVFRNAPASLPVIKVRQFAERTLVSVELPLIGRLPTDPRAQLQFLEIFQMLFDRADNI